MMLKCLIPIALGRNQLETDTNDILYNTSPFNQTFKLEIYLQQV